MLYDNTHELQRIFHKIILESEGLQDDKELTQEQMTLKEYFDKARDEDGQLLVRFIKITDNTERTVVFSNAADVGATFNNSVEVSPSTLKTINKNHKIILNNLTSKNKTRSGSTPNIGRQTLELERNRLAA